MKTKKVLKRKVEKVNLELEFQKLRMYLAQAQPIGWAYIYVKKEQPIKSCPQNLFI